jgi:hypothetical protein
MSQDSEDFGPLRRLLALKRHEQPPPGYFDSFSRQVIARIIAGEGVDENVLDRVFWEVPWSRRLWMALEARAKPILAGAFGAAVCSLLVFGVIYSEKTDVDPVAGLAVPGTPTANTIQFANVSSSDQPLLAQPTTIGLSDQSAMGQPIAAGGGRRTLFDLVPTPQADAASVGLTLIPERN